jgi:hemolysin III
VSISQAQLEREQSREEEIANSFSHGLGLIAALAATPPLLSHAFRHGHTGYLVGATLFAATMVLLYLASALYHALPPGKAKDLFNKIEHSAIFLLIAGTYTPFTLGALRGPWGWTLLVLVWVLAIVGVVLKVRKRLQSRIVSTGLYLLMGWLLIVAIKPFLARVPASGHLWVAAGGLAYTVGVIFFVTDSRLRFGHCIWHLFVMMGTACHYCAVLWYAA